ncbi:MarR family winged helix-turn-helix transcriptional regulator [Agrobacterium tumefaciens]|uniref:Winged helix-turn-helix transcriptional regulator n=1 Tax=Agrobacterium tumefaciens TaxID=358 RepID=A0AA44J941_AGRTU|nr:MarR family winged helix-turn-helix transcriptional regulator [Agrobacterium tumefaciens]NTB87538.1 winged helix-turn-helix transcriptional regulator [Agrobacterium tumefaciens]NTC17523.1 winged helix-turn-helix transcriptional regulator [Agrobacterium tumefaciens]NTC29695.1 winged helix-turn-helix transcriptional regulator [Agrobacterium tumefaciens]
MDEDLLKIMELFGAVNNRFQLRLRSLAGLESVGLTAYEARTLALIARNPGCSQLMIGTWTDRDKAQVARTVKELEARKMIVRATNPADWRAHSLELTEEGRRCFEFLDGQRHEIGTDMMQDVSTEEKRVLAHALAKMKARLGQG